MPRVIIDLDEYLSLDASDLADSVFDCTACGKQHRMPIQKIQLGTHLVDELEEIAATILGGRPRKPVLVYDRAIEDIIQVAVVDRLPRMPVFKAGLGAKGTLLEASDMLGDEAARMLPVDTDVIIGAGSGVIADLTKWIATRASKPFILYGTAPSMNAHTSITSAMTVQGIKTSILLDPAWAVLFDTPLLAESPKAMRLAGMGDLAARAVCNADWQLAHQIRQTYFCPVPFQLTGANKSLYLAEAEGIGRGESSSVGLLGEAVLVSGLSMSMLGGETSPSSGSEHVFSHYWDLQVELEGAPKNLHGTQAGVGTRLSYALFNVMRKLDMSRVDPLRLLRQRLPLEALTAQNRAKFGPKAHLFDEVLCKKWTPDADFIFHVRRILDRWEEIWQAVEPYLEPLETVQAPMESSGFVFSLETIQRTRQQALDALIFGSRYRSRYTLLDLAWELGVLPGAAEEILDLARLG